jgi:hypothetical protein
MNRAVTRKRLLTYTDNPNNCGKESFKSISNASSNSNVEYSVAKSPELKENSRVTPTLLTTGAYGPNCPA